MDLGDLARLSREAPRDELPELLGRLTEAEAVVRLRLAEPAQASSRPAELIDAERAAAIAGTSKRWIIAATRGLSLRRDLSRKRPRFEEAGLREWLARRKR